MAREHRARERTAIEHIESHLPSKDHKKDSGARAKTGMVSKRSQLSSGRRAEQGEELCILWRLFLL